MTFLPGALFASASIGAVIAVAGVLIAATTGARDGAGALVAAPLAVMLAIPVGFVASIIPNLTGSALLAWLGRGNVGLRLPALWALAGAAFGLGLANALSGGDPGAEGGATMAGIGAVSALLCRWKTAWTDDTLIREASNEPDRPHPARAVARPRRHAADRWLD